MTTKQIANPNQSFVTGATWGNPSGENEAATDFSALLNGTGLVLYTGDIVCLDVTGTQAVLAGAASDPTQFGVVGLGVGNSTYPVGSTAINVSTVPYFVQTSELSAARTDNAGFTNGSTTVTDTSAIAADQGKAIITPYNSSTNATPQIFTITAVTPGTGYTVNTAFTGTTGTLSVQVLNGPVSFQSGWAPTSYSPGSIVPIITAGFGRVNINGATTLAAKGLVGVSGNGAVTGFYTAQGSAVATTLGGFIAVALEAYAARDTTLTALGITGHDSVRAIIGKF